VNRIQSPYEKSGTAVAFHVVGGKTMSISLTSSSSVMYPDTSSLAHYNTNELEDLPSDATMGILADGEIFSKTYNMLTQSDLSLLNAITGKSFDSSTIAQEQADGTFTGDPLAEAIGFARVDSVLFPNTDSSLSVDLTTSSIQTIERSIDSSLSSCSNEGVAVPFSELSDAFTYLTQQETVSSGSSINTSA